MEDPEPFDDPGPLVSQPAGRARRIATVAIIALLIVSMVFLAFVSGRGFVTPAPGPDQPVPTLHEAAATAIPSPSPAQRLALVDEGGRLVIADAAGKASAPFGEAGITYSFPAWSPAGDRIAAIGDDHGTGVVHVFTFGQSGAQAVAPTTVYDSADRPPFYLYWSPDGTRVSFLTSKVDGTIDLRVAPADASAAATVVRNGAPMYWAWTPQGRLLVHSGADSADAFIGEVEPDGGAAVPRLGASGGFRTPAISPDGSFLGYVGRGSADPEVILQGRDGTGRRAVSVHGEAAMDFSPTSADLAFLAPAEAGRELAVPVGPLRVLSPARDDARVLLPGPVVAFFWAPDGRTIAAFQLGASTDDNVALDGRGTAVLARAPVAAAAPGVALRLVFVDTASGTTRGARAIQVGEVFASQVLPYFDQYALSHRFWSPDSQTIALPITADDGTAGIVAVPTDGGPATRIADGVAAAWSP
jgi:TolB protein